MGVTPLAFLSHGPHEDEEMLKGLQVLPETQKPGKGACFQCEQPANLTQHFRRYIRKLHLAVKGVRPHPREDQSAGDGMLNNQDEALGHTGLTGICHRLPGMASFPLICTYFLGESSAEGRKAPLH